MEGVHVTWPGMPRPIFAEKLVSKLVLEKPPAVVHIGAHRWIAYTMWAVAWFASWFVGVRWWDWLMAGPSGLRELKKINQAKEREGKKGR